MVLSYEASSADGQALELVHSREIHDEHSSEQSDAQLWWWRKTGPTLATLLSEAGYSPRSQAANLSFYACFIVSELGPAPGLPSCIPQWPSFMTDDGTPIELSWDWGWANEPVTIRYSIEPVGLHAGTLSDPLNEHAGYRLFRRVQRSSPKINLSWFDHFWKELMSFGGQPKDYSDSLSSEGHQSSFFVAFDLHETAQMKAYFLPSFKAAELGLSKLELISQAVARLPNNELFDFCAFDELRKYVSNAPRQLRLEVEMFAIDCTEPSLSRLKLYIRSWSTDFTSVREIMTLGGCTSNEDIEHCLDQLHGLWDTLFSITGCTEPLPRLPNKEHRTAGILYNFEIRPGKKFPVSKIYLPVRHYARSDSSVMMGLRLHLNNCKEGATFERYVRAMEQIL